MKTSQGFAKQVREATTFVHGCGEQFLKRDAQIEGVASLLYQEEGPASAVFSGGKPVGTADARAANRGQNLSFSSCLRHKAEPGPGAAQIVAPGNPVLPLQVRRRSVWEAQL